VHSLVSGYANEHIISQSPSPEVETVAAGGASGIKHLEVHGRVHSRSRLCGCCRPASGHTVRCVSERGPVINEGPHQI